MQIVGSSLAVGPANEVILEGNDPVSGQDEPNKFRRPRIGDTLSIHLSQNAGSAAVWEIIVYVQVAQGWFAVDAIATTPPSLGAIPARTVGFAFVPGAIGWKVLCTCQTDDEIADLVLQSSECSGGGMFGVSPNPPLPPEGNGFLIFPTLAAASLFNTTGLEEGTPAWIQSVRRLYILEPASTDAVTGADIITASPAGRWEAAAPG